MSRPHPRITLRAHAAFARPSPPRRSIASRAPQVQPTRLDVIRMACVFGAPPLASLAALGILWSGIVVGAAKGPNNAAVPRQILPQASPPFGPWVQPSNGATCGARRPAERGRREGRGLGVGGSARRWSVDDAQTRLAQGSRCTNARRLPSARRTQGLWYASRHAPPSHHSMLPQRGARTSALRRPLD